MRPKTVGTLAVLAAATALAPPIVTGPSQGAPVQQTTQSAAWRDRCRLPGPYELPHGRQRVDLDPADFTARITNRYWPMRPGTTWTYRETGGQSTMRVRVTVTDRTREVRGIRARVVHDVVRESGELVENTFDWYAQDSGGSLWYLGERTREFENGQVVSREGSWEYGVDGAQAGILIPADPRPGCRYRQEQSAGEAEDRGSILSTRAAVTVPVGSYQDVLTTADTTPLEPGLLEHKFYAPGVGPLLAVGISPRAAREVLVDLKR